MISIIIDNMKQKYNHNIEALTSFHINRLNNVQSTINRLSNIGYTLLSLNLAISGIVIPILFSLSMTWYVRIVLAVVLVFVTCVMFYCFAVNLKNERIFIKVYNNLLAMDLNKLSQEENPWAQIASVNFVKFKKENKELEKESFKTRMIKYKSWVSLLWMTILIIDIVSLIMSVLVR